MFASHDLRLEGITITDGESGIKQCKNIEADNCKFYGKYPWWHVDGSIITNCYFAPGSRSAIWYSNDMKMKDCVIDGPKFFREMKNLELENVIINDADETFWRVDGIRIKNVKLHDGTYPFMFSQNIFIDGLESDSKYVFQYCKNVEIQVEIEMNGETVTDEIGFRTIETRGKQLLLNGEPIFLKGISIHEEKPNGGGRANCSADAHTLLSWAKELGCNFVRLAHYPHNEYAVREAERMGILVWSEIPVYWTIDWKNLQTYTNAERQLEDMIARDHNRANVIIWSIANETPHSAERDNFLGRLAKHARQLDPTRLISMAMEVTSASNYKNRLISTACVFSSFVPPFQHLI